MRAAGSSGRSCAQTPDRTDATDRAIRRQEDRGTADAAHQVTAPSRRYPCRFHCPLAGYGPARSRRHDAAQNAAVVDQGFRLDDPRPVYRCGCCGLRGRLCRPGGPERGCQLSAFSCQQDRRTADRHPRPGAAAFSIGRGARQSECRPGGPYGALRQAHDQRRRMNSPPRTGASVGPEGRTER